MVVLGGGNSLEEEEAGEAPACLPRSATEEMEKGALETARWGVVVSGGAERLTG